MFKITADDVRRMANDPAYFRSRLVIDHDGEKLSLGEHLDPWQRKDFESMDAGWRLIMARHGDSQGVRMRAYLERPRGHSKTGDIATAVLYALAFTNRRISGIAAAADQDQSRLLRDHIDRLVELNPWLKEIVKVQSYEVFGRMGSMLEIIASDAGSSYGSTPDFIVCDELTHWPAKGEQLWTAVMSAVAKRKNCVFIVISNAGVGMGTSWQWKIREAMRTDEAVYFSRQNGPTASWMTETRLEEQRRLLSPNAYRRLFLNQWVVESGDALDGTDIDLAIQPGGPLTARECGWIYGMGVDLGLRHDATGMVVVGRHMGTGRYRLAQVKRRKATPANPISLNSIQEEVRQLATQFRAESILIDGWQAEHMTENLKRLRIPIETFSMNLANQNKVARHLLSVFQDGIISLYKHDRFLLELRATSLVERVSQQIQLVWPRDDSGHGDMAAAFVIALWAAKEARPNRDGATVPAQASFIGPDGKWVRIGGRHDRAARLHRLMMGN